MNKVLFFAHLRDEAGAESVMMDAAGKTVAELKTLIAKKYGVTRLDTAMVAINEEFAPDADRIGDGDIIAFIPPVSGG
ncbi:molybdopterin converting factor subunit 1 [Bacillus massilinigeriensis]|uniref:molybdopterin converting factor subunit 1 n=1 Tax=Bacillus mediterraneensis TaxID=1805474 RepID=UPI0008F88D61|nr:molybdopterin converting factor subunit 1 [Bacillus mediterraneensis]